MSIFEFIDNFINVLLNDMGAFAPILACLLIIVESMLPVLPLAAFITLNFLYMGKLVGFIVSWLLTCLGCYISYKLCKNKLKHHFDNMLDKKDHKRLKKFMRRINRLKFEELVLIIAVPYTPAFMVNIAAGLSDMKDKKFIFSILIGKIFLVLFWGLVGTGLVESLKDIRILIIILTALLIAFVISKIVNKKYNIE